MSKSAVGRALQIAELPDNVKEQAKEENWTASRLLDLAKPKRAPIRAKRNDIGVVEAQVARLRVAWKAAGSEARRQFRAELDNEVDQESGS